MAWLSPGCTKPLTKELHLVINYAHIITFFVMKLDEGKYSTEEPRRLDSFTQTARQRRATLLDSS